MPVRLWHFTWPEHVESILANGLQDGTQGFVFFAPPGDTYWELSGKILLEVSIDVDDTPVDFYKYESIDYGKNNFCQITFRIPAAFLKDHKATIRIVPVDEYRRPITG